MRLFDFRSAGTYLTQIDFFEEEHKSMGKFSPSSFPLTWAYATYKMESARSIWKGIWDRRRRQTIVWVWEIHRDGGGGQPRSRQALLRATIRIYNGRFGPWNCSLGHDGLRGLPPCQWAFTSLTLPLSFDNLGFYSLFWWCISPVRT